MPSGALAIGTTVPDGGTAGGPAVAGSAAGVAVRAGTGVVVGAGGSASLLQSASARLIASKHTAAERGFITLVPDRNDELLPRARSYTLINLRCPSQRALRPHTITVLAIQNGDRARHVRPECYGFLNSLRWQSRPNAAPNSLKHLDDATGWVEMDVCNGVPIGDDRGDIAPAGSGE